MNFNKLKNKYKLLILLAIELIIALIYINTENDSIEIIIIVIYFIIFFFIFKIIWQMFNTNIFGSIKDFLKKLLKFIISKTKFMFRQMKLILKAMGLGGYFDGMDKTSFEFDLNIRNKFHRLFRTKTKLDLQKADENSEKIKLMYIKLILNSINKGYDYKNSQTPDEIFIMLNNKNLEFLISCYKSVRYGKNIRITNEELSVCELNLDNIYKKN